MLGGLVNASIETTRSFKTLEVEKLGLENQHVDDELLKKECNLWL